MNTNKKEGLRHPEIFRNNERVHVIGYGMGTVIGYVDNAKAVRIEFDSKNIRDFHPNKLRDRLVPVS